MNDSAVKKATGSSLDYWISCIKKEGLEKSSHKEIAVFLSTYDTISPWWAQQITVFYEKAAGQRITGQTLESGFQVDVRKTISSNVKELWKQVISAEGMYFFTGDRVNAMEVIDQNRTGKFGIEYCITTFRPGMHWRMKWRKPEWPNHSIVQVRVYESNSGKAVLAIHQEKLSGPAVREEMKAWWKDTVNRVELFFK